MKFTIWRIIIIIIAAIAIWLMRGNQGQEKSGDDYAMDDPVQVDGGVGVERETPPGDVPAVQPAAPGE